MPKLLLQREKKEYVKEIDREITVVKQREYFVTDPAKAYSTKDGTVKVNDMKKRDGSTVKSTMGKEYVLLSASFLDLFKRLHRGPQTMSLKDLGLVITEAGIGKETVIVDAGTGSGAAACVLAHIAKKVYSFDIRPDNVEIGKKNAKFLGLTNVSFAVGDIYQKCPVKNADVCLLDVPDPSKAIKTAASVVRIGGFVVAYTLQATQLQQFVKTMKDDKRFLVIKSVELIERSWKVDGDVLRPHNISIGHTGFLTFVRRIQ